MGSKRKSRKRSRSRGERDRSISSVANTSADSDRSLDRVSRHRSKNTKHIRSRKHHRSVRKVAKRDMTPPLPPLQETTIQQRDSVSQASGSAAQNISSATATYGTSSSLVDVPCFPIHPNMMNNVVPEFDPSDSTQSIETWIHKVNECGKIYNWNETQICHFALPKLSGLAKRWYQGLPSLMFTWDEWKNKLLLAFPSNENYGDLLIKMLKIRCKFGEPLDVYYYDKMALLNKCEINGSKAVGCLLQGIEDKFIRMGASAGRFSDPEQLFSYLRQVTVSQVTGLNKDESDTELNTHQDQVAAGDFQKQMKCFNCGEIGHISLKCPKPLKKCMIIF